MPGVIVELHEFAGDILIDSEDEAEASEVEASEIPMKPPPLKVNPLWVRKERIETFERSEFESDLNNDSNWPKNFFMKPCCMFLWLFGIPFAFLLYPFLDEVSHKKKT